MLLIIRSGLLKLNLFIQGNDFAYHRCSKYLDCLVFGGSDFIQFETMCKEAAIGHFILTLTDMGGLLCHVKELFCIICYGFLGRGNVINLIVAYCENFQK